MTTPLNKQTLLHQTTPPVTMITCTSPYIIETSGQRWLIMTSRLRHRAISIAATRNPQTMEPMCAPVSLLTFQSTIACVPTTRIKSLGMAIRTPLFLLSQADCILH